MKTHTKRPAPGGAQTQTKGGPQPAAAAAAAAAEEPEKSLKQHFHEGLAAALKTHPDALHTSRPRTVLGEIVRQLAMRAGNGQCDAIRLVAHLLDVSAEAAWNKTETNIQAGRRPAGERRWDWTADGKWDCPDRPATEGAGEAGSPPLWDQLYARVLRTADAEREEEARKTRLMGGAAPAEPASGSLAETQFPASGNFSGNCGANPSPALSVRIAGKQV